MSSPYAVRNVLISDDIDPSCVELLQKAGVDVKLKSKWEKGELIKEIEKYDALIVRSATKVSAELINAATRLKLIGRAGTGVDNVDLDAATARGIIVMNTPAGNSRSAAELTCLFIASLARRVPQACASLKQGSWDRKNYMGTELHGKVLAIIGLGRIGREVAERMQAFGMETIGFDPLVSAEDSAKFGVKSLKLDDIWPLADYITVHVPLIKQTENLINSKVFGMCKKGVKIINCARGGIVSEEDLLTALKDGRCGGAALDVFTEEPPPVSLKPLLEHPNLICAPHLGASTIEAQIRVAREIAEQIILLNEGKALLGALNAGAVASAIDPIASHSVVAVEDLCVVLRTLAFAKDLPSKLTVRVSAPEKLKPLELSLKASALVGFLKSPDRADLNLISVVAVAKAASIEATVTFDSGSKFVSVSIASGGDLRKDLSLTGVGGPLGTSLLGVAQESFPNGVQLNGSVLFFEGPDAQFSDLQKSISVKPQTIYHGLLDKWHAASYQSALEKNAVEAVKAKNASVVIVNKH